MFEKAFVKVIKSFKANQKFVEEGDFKINYDNINLSQTISNYSNHINSVGCSQLVDKLTRISGTGTIIDHIYINSKLINYVLPVIIQDDISDRMPICTELRCKLNKKCTKQPLLKN